MKFKLTSLVLALLLAACTNQETTQEISLDEGIPPINKSLASKPPMGWNSWDCLGFGANESEVRAAADYMAKNLNHLGYEYIVIDMMWYGDAIASDYEAFAHETMPVKPYYTVDEFGRLFPDPVKFPSSVEGKGFKPLADYIHGLGLKFGVHLMRGIPWQAHEENMTIKGTDIGAASIAQPDNGCVWYDGIYGVDMTKPGSQEYYNSVYELLSEWGVDFVKCDDVTNQSELEAISRALRSCGRDMVLSLVPHNFPMEVLKANCHMARISADFWDVWQMVKVGFPDAARVVKYAEPGFWPDLDMLPVGKLGKKITYKGPDERISRFNEEELHTLMTLWYIARQPLMIGGYLPETDELTLEILSNEEALAVNRECINPRQVKFKNAIIIWTADIPDSEDKYLAFFNQWETKTPVEIKVEMVEIGLDPDTRYKVRDLWARKDIGTCKGEFSAPIKMHGAGLFKISK